MQLVVLGDFFSGMKSCPVNNGDDFINHEIRIPSLNNQDSMESNKFFFKVAHMRF